jgi:hypothetical protein
MSHQYQRLTELTLTTVPDFIPNPDGTYTSFNPKTKRGVDGSRVILDRPSTTGSVRQRDVYTHPMLDRYTPFNMNKGQVQYYIDNTIKDAYYEPVYDIPSSTVMVPYVDPMSSFKPHYIQCMDQQILKEYSPYSFIRDTAFYRENLTASQQAKTNQERITPFF